MCKKDKKDKKPSFESCLSLIDNELNKRRHKWTLHAVVYMNWDDVEQQIRLHIWKKWEQYDPKKPLVNWVNAIISNQVSNIRRNLYDAHARPCLKCAENQGGNLCAKYELQDNRCPLYEHWEKTKKRAHDTKLPVSMENHSQDVFNMPDVNIDIFHKKEIINKKMKEILKPVEWKVYHCLYIMDFSEEETAKKMGYKTSESNRRPGYATILKIKKNIIEKLKKAISQDEIDI